MSWRERAACQGEDTELWFPTDRYDRRGLDSPDTRASIALSSEECAEVRHARSKRAWSARRSWGADKEATA